MDDSMQPASAQIDGKTHYEWVDIARGMAILWIVYYHFFLAYANVQDFLTTFTAFLHKEATARVLMDALIGSVVQQGPGGVGIFLLFSGFGLTYSVLKRNSEIRWGQWYKRRLIRLYPVYWLGHLITLVVPFPEKNAWYYTFDYRFFLSLLGDRIYPIRLMFHYLNPAWWFLGLLLELYIVFPFLLWLLRRIGSLPYFVLCAGAAVASRCILYYVMKAESEYVMGGFFVCRLFEFGAGMALGKLMAERPVETRKWLLSFRCLLPGIALYVASLSDTALYSGSAEGLKGVGLSLMFAYIGNWLAKVPGLGKALALVGLYSYGLFIFHYPFVIIAGYQMRPLPVVAFYALATVLMIPLAAASIGVEYTVNRLVSALPGMGPKSKSRVNGLKGPARQ